MPTESSGVYGVLPADQVITARIFGAGIPAMTLALLRCYADATPAQLRRYADARLQRHD